jgi:hypothetical protein
LTRGSCSVRATAYLSKSPRRFLKTNVDKSYYTKFKKYVLIIIFFEIVQFDNFLAPYDQI